MTAAVETREEGSGVRPTSDGKIQRSQRLFQLGLAVHVAILLLVGSFLVTLVLLVLWFVYGQPSFPKPSEIAPATFFNALKVAFALVASVGGVVALVVAYRRQRLNEEEHRRQEEAVGRERNRLFQERFSRAAEQLGSDRPAIRLAGVYAMAGLADDWESGRQVCIDVLCAYLRMPAATVKPIPSYEGSEHARPKPWMVVPGPITDDSDGKRHAATEENEVRATVIRVVRDHLSTDLDPNWLGHRFDFTGAVFEDAEFDGVEFVDCEVVFDNCLFLGECGFSQSKMLRSDVSFLGAVYAGRVGFEYSEIEDSEVTLYGDLTSAGDLTFQGAKLVSGELRFLGPRKHGGAVGFVSSNLEGGRITISNPVMTEDTSIAFSRSVISGTDVLIEGGEYQAGAIWCNGVEISGGSFVLKPARFGPGPVSLAGTELSIDGCLISGGKVALNDVRIDGSDVHFGELEMSGGLLDLSGTVLMSGTLRFSDLNVDGAQVALGDLGSESGGAAILDQLRQAGAVLIGPHS